MIAMLAMTLLLVPATQNDWCGRLSDPNGIDEARLSPDGRKVAYALYPRENPDRNSDAMPRITTLVWIDRRNGRRLGALDIPSGSKTTMDLGWRNDHVVWIAGHYRPSAGVYIEVDLRRRKVVRELEIGSLALSARGEVASAMGSISSTGEALHIDDRRVYPRKGDARKHRLGDTPTWSFDGLHLAFIDYLPWQGTTDVVITDRHGSVRRRVRIDTKEPGEVDVYEPSPFELHWLNNTTLAAAEGDDAWLRIDLSGRLKRITSSLPHSGRTPSVQDCTFSVGVCRCPSP